RPGTGWAIATGLCIACYSLVDKVGVSHINPLPYLWAMMLGSCVSLLPAVRARPGSMARAWRENRLAVLLSGVLSPAGYLVVLFAFRLSKAGYVVAGREVSIVISALIGSILFKEGPLPQRLPGAAVGAFWVGCVPPRPSAQRWCPLGWSVSPSPARAGAVRFRARGAVLRSPPAQAGRSSSDAQRGGAHMES